MARLAPRRAIVILLALSLTTFTYVTAELSPIGLLPLIAADLGVSPSAVGFLVSGYGLVVVVTSIPLTLLTRRIPRRLLLSVLLSVFIVSSAASAVVADYWMLLGSRLVTALSQALFWSVVTPAAASLFEPQVRGRAISILYGGSSLAVVVGVPVGTWLGQVAGWRSPFLALSALGLIALVLVAALLPTAPPGDGAADHGSAPDAGRYRALVIATALAVTGGFTTFTYLSPFLADVTGLQATAVTPILFVRGVAGVLGVVLIGLVVDRNPWLAMISVIVVQGVALTAQYALGDAPLAAGVTVAAAGLAIAAFSAVLGTRVLIVAPGSSDMASAGTSTAFDVGITAGALLGGLLLPAAGVRSTALVGAALTAVALAVTLAEPLMSSKRQPRHRVKRAAGRISHLTPATPSSRRSQPV
jgi:DHA1 family inner membrane transport protein